MTQRRRLPSVPSPDIARCWTCFTPIRRHPKLRAHEAQTSCTRPECRRKDRAYRARFKAAKRRETETLRPEALN